MKKILKWLKSPKSDFALFILLLILANIVGYKAFVRFDLTAQKSYSLSKESKNLVKNLSEPLSVKVFFDENLPPPYNSVSQYVKDILTEYKQAGNKNFSVDFLNMKKTENSELANELGLSQIQIQEVKNNEVGLKQCFMGLVLTYGDNIEILNPITSTDSFEFTLTSKITKMINTQDALSGLNENEKITLTLYFSDSIKKLRISGSEQVEQIVENAFKNSNKILNDRIEFNKINPSSEQVASLVNQYGIQQINYQNEKGETLSAAVGLVLEHGEKFNSLPLEISRSLFGYTFAGLEDLETTISEGVQTLLSNVTQIGYITGHNELDHTAENYSANFDRLVSGMYEFVDLDLSKDEIPSGMKSIVINGPQFDYTEEELYKIDQFVMKGGNILCFVDNMIQDGTAQYYGTETFVKNELNLDRLLNSYGVKREFNLVMDKNCYKNQNQQFGELNLYWAPILQKGQMLKKHPITQNLGFVIMYLNGELNVEQAQADKNIDVTILAKSSPKSWVLSEGISLNPLMQPPEDSQLSSKNLAVLLEGKFNSAFEKAVITPLKDEEGNEIELPEDTLNATKHISQSVLPGKILVIGSSFVTTKTVIDENGTTPVSMFVMNTVDYMNGNEELCTMRTKSLAINTLEVKSPFAATFWKFFNQYGLVIILLIVALFVWRTRVSRKRAINKKYNPNDARTIEK